MRHIICFLFFFILNTAFAQDKKAISEEEYAVLQYKIRQSFNANIDSAFVYANQMAKSNNNKHLAFANAAMSTLWQCMGKAELSKKKYQKALFYLDKVPDSKDKVALKSYVLNYAGLAEWKRGNFSEAIEQYQEGLKLSKQIGDIIQIFKFKANIAKVNEEVGNYQLAIRNTRELNDFLIENRDLFPKVEFLNRKSGIYFDLGSEYESYFMKNHDKKILLDSAEYFYKMAISYSQDFDQQRASAKLSLGNIYNWRADYKNALKIYSELALLPQQNNQKDILCVANYNLADVYETLKMYNQALFFYKKSDSIATLTNINQLDYLKSNYHQSKIYIILKKPELAYKHSKIYLDSKKKYEEKLNKERVGVNELQGIDNLTKEMVSFERNYEKNLLYSRGVKIFSSLLFIVIGILLIKKSRDKNKGYKKMNTVLQEFKTNIEKGNYPEDKEILFGNEKNLHERENLNLSIDDSKENEVVEKLLVLEKKLEYLSVNFTLSQVAKKIETNTIYLSYVINKRFGKSFEEYSNDLKINYVIYEMIANERYRKQSVKSIAESTGFENAISFEKIFRKRTGVSPIRFVDNI